MGKILVIGSSNTDLIAQVSHFPAAGETIRGLSFMQAMGGKGANQALAAHRAGGDVSFVTCLGTDANGQNAFSYYQRQGLDVSLSLQTDGVPSGTAMIWVDQNGENCIVITPGANEHLRAQYIEKIRGAVSSADLVVLQMEIPYETVVAVCGIASEYGKKVLLNVAPARAIDALLMQKIDILVVNETEAEAVSGRRIEEVGEDQVMETLMAMGADTVILTLGKQGCLFRNGRLRLSQSAFPVKAVDSTAAGDTFCGALAAGLGKGMNWKDVLRFASAAAAISVTRMGAQPSIPSEAEIRCFLSEQEPL